MKKTLIYASFAIGLGLISYTTFKILKKIGDARIDARTVTREEALAILKKSR